MPLVLNTYKFIEKARLIHGNKYDYSLVDYKHSRIKVTIICPIHGKFDQNPSGHLSKNECDKCGRIRRQTTINNLGLQVTGSWTFSEWEKLALKSKNFENYQVYIIKCWNNNESFYKIGKTFKNIKQRFYKPRDMPYNWKIIKIFIGLNFISILLSFILSWFNKTVNKILMG